MMNETKQGPQVEYPCRWVYKVIGGDADEIHTALREIFQERCCEVSLSRRSRRGKYHCLNVETTIFSDNDRKSLFSQLSRHSAVKIVL